jgi:hypothetical protein
MLPLRLWLRRSTATIAFPGMLIIEFMVVFSRPGWTHEWGWALGQASIGTVLLAPLLAGVVALDRARRVEPTVALLASGSPRGRLGILALPVASCAWATAAWLAGMACAALIAARGGAVGPPDPWIFIEPPVLLILAACVGLAVGTLMKGPLAGPVAALILLLGRLLIGNLNLRLEGILAAGGAGGSQAGIIRNPLSASALVSIHLAMSAMAIILVVTKSPGILGRGALRVISLTAGVVLVLVSGYALHAVSARMAPYQAEAGHDICLSGRAVVCGHYQANYVLDASQKSLSIAFDALSGSGIKWQEKYNLYNGLVVPPDHGVLQVVVEDVKDGELSNFDVANTLASPRNCRELFGDRPPEQIMTDQQVVRDWVSKALDAGPPSDPAPQGVREAYQRLRACPPMTEPVG